MKDTEDHLIAVKILDRDYKVKCPADKTKALQESASYVDEQMRKLLQSTTVHSTDRVAIITALNICHEFMQLKKQKDNYIDIMNQRIQDLQRRVENFLASNEEIAV